MKYFFNVGTADIFAIDHINDEYAGNTLQGETRFTTTTSRGEQANIALDFSYDLYFDDLVIEGIGDIFDHYTHDMCVPTALSYDHLLDEVRGHINDIKHLYA